MNVHLNMPMYHVFIYKCLNLAYLYLLSQNRLVCYRIVLEWALEGETLGRGNRKPLPSCVVGTIRQRYPSDSGVSVGFQEIHEAVDM